MKYCLSIVILISLFFTSCRKKDIISDNPDDQISFSTDSLLFDTVFSTIGSSTRNFKIYNKNKQKLVISSIKLAGGSSSLFRININGQSKTEFSNLELNANDSLWVFAEVTINPQANNLPFIVTDSIVFVSNTKTQDVQLAAFGQNAIFHRPSTEGTNVFILPKNDVWVSDTPHVVYGLAVIDSGSTLTINKGATVHFHPGSGLVSYKASSLKINGTKDEPVKLEGDRLEPWYEETPGQWGGILLYPLSVNNEINYAIIKNAQIGIQCDTVDLTDGNPTLTLKNTIIKNCSEYGILGRGTSIKAYNCLVSNCGSYCGAFIMGGYYELYQCTFANYWSFYSKSRETPAVVVNNWYKDNNGTVIGRDLNNADFYNCIIYGSQEHELAVSEKDGFTFNYTFNNTLFKAKKEDLDYTQANFINCIVNENPAFEGNTDFHLKETSEAIDKGDASAVSNNSSLISNDLDDNSRNSDAAPDLGCYEFQP